MAGSSSMRPGNFPSGRCRGARVVASDAVMVPSGSLRQRYRLLAPTTTCAKAAEHRQSARCWMGSANLFDRTADPKRRGRYHPEGGREAARHRQRLATTALGRCPLETVRLPDFASKPKAARGAVP